MTIKSGDRLSPKSGSVVFVHCANNTIATVRLPSGLGTICPGSVAQRFSTKGRGEEDFLAFLNQRFVFSSQFLDPYPQFRWNPVQGVNNYQVKILDNSAEPITIWEAETNQNEIKYGSASLESEKSYTFLVFDAANPEHLLHRLVFGLLSPESSQTLDKKLNSTTQN